MIEKLTTDLNVNPYYNDYDITKGFLQILFKPGYAVQAREVTQLQSILQEQSARIGEHLFKHGSPVIGGALTLDTDVKYIQLSSVDDITVFANGIITDSFNFIRAQVLAYEVASGTDTAMLIVKYLAGTSFPAESTILLEQTNTTAIVKTSAPTGNASIVSINRGIFYINGYFVSCEPQTLILEKYTNTPTYRIGLSIIESIVSSDADTTLLDPASGTPNFNAPGANRLKMVLSLTKQDAVTADASSDFIELMRIVSGIPTSQTKYPVYTELEKTLARRTFDESGDYTIKPFPVRLLSHQGSTGITQANVNTIITGIATKFIDDFSVGDEIYLSSDITATATILSITDDLNMTLNNSVTLGDGTDQTIFNKERISVALESGKAYVKGHEFENIATEFVDVKRGRDFKTDTSFQVNPNFGNYMKITKLNSGSGVNIFDPNEINELDLHCVPYDSIVGTSASTQGKTKIGTTKIRQMDYVEGSVDSVAMAELTIFDLHIFDTQLSIISGTVATSYLAGASTIELQDVSTVTDSYNNTKVTIGDETRTIVAYDGTTTTATLNVGFSNNISSTTPCSISASIGEVKSLIYNSFSGGVIDGTRMNVSNSSIINNTTQVFDSNISSLVFDTNVKNIKSISSNGISYSRKITLNANFSTINGSLTATITTPTGIFANEGLQSGQLSSELSNFIVIATEEIILTHDNTSTTISPGELIGVDASFDNATKNQFVLTLKRNGVTSVDVSQTLNTKVYATIIETDIVAKTKTLVNPTTSSFAPNSTVLTRLIAGQIVLSSIDETQSLLVPDCIGIHSIIEDASGTFSTLLLSEAVGNASHINNVTGDYTFDTGQKDNFYDHASITLKKGKTKTSNPILVLFSYYEHSTAYGYSTVDSYINTPFNNIPEFTSPISGITKSLRDSIDFRPLKLMNDISGITSNPYIPDADIPLIMDVDYYLPRKDKLVLTKERTFSIIEGISEDNPILPADNEDAMTLYNIDIPSYTFNATDIDVQYIDNRRFTMRDIGKIEKRVDNLEYYTALSMLEKEATELSIMDASTGIERFKNGILVDSFNGHNIGDVSNPDFQCSIDQESKELRPSFNSESYKFDHVSTDSVTRNGDLVTIGYTTTPEISQPLASDIQTVNPFGTNQFNGKLTLTPNSDVWYSKTERPDILINMEGLNDHWVMGNDNGFGKQWDDWSFTWSGVQINEDNFIKSRKTTNTTNRTTNIISQNKTRTGIVSTKAPESIKRTVGNRTVNVSIIQSMRKQNIMFVATGVKPNINFNAFFDNTPSNKYIKPATLLTITADITSYNAGQFNTTPSEQDIVTQGTTTGTILYQNASSILISNIVQDVVLSSDTNIAIATIGEIITISNATDSSTGILQGIDVVNKTITLGSIDGIIYDGVDTSVTGSVTGLFGTQVVTPGNFTFGEVYSGVGSFRVSGNVTGATTHNSNDQLTSDDNGVFAGEFIVPSNTFKIGEKLLRFTDSVTDELSETETVAEKVYRSQGLIESRDGKITSTRPIESKRENVKSKDVVSDSVSRSTTSTNWINPLSQTYIVNKNEHPNGFFIDSVDVIFASKDNKLPVTLQIRTVKNGLPSASSVVPFSEITLNPIDINVDSSTPDLTDSSSYTKFKFESPVYLYPDEYSITLTTSSNKYSVHVSSLGDIVLNTTNTNVSSQPNVGDFFDPQNSSIWDKLASKQLMFNINRCVFNTGSYTTQFENQIVPQSNNLTGINYDVFKLSTSELVFANTKLDFEYKGTTDSSYIKFNANKNVVLTEQKIINSATNSTSTKIVTGNNSPKGDFDLQTTLSTTDSKISPVIDLSRLNVIVVENIINQGSLKTEDLTIINGGNSYTSAPSISILNGGGSGATAVTTIDGNGVIDSVTITNGGINYYENPTITINDNPSIVIDANIGQIVVSNELDSSGGNCLAKYITKRVTLEDGFDAKDIKVVLNAYKPKNTDIKLYYKVHNIDDPDSFDIKKYVLMSQQTDNNLISSNEFDIKEYVFKSIDDDISYISNNITYDKFKTFSIKIVLGSSNTTVVPKIKDLKAIALDF